MNLKTGGIYTEEKCVTLIIEQTAEKYFLLRFKSSEYIHEKIQDRIKNIITNFESISARSAYMCFSLKNSNLLYSNIDGYLGQIDNELLMQARKKLHELSFYYDWKKWGK